MVLIAEPIKTLMWEKLIQSGTDKQYGFGLPKYLPVTKRFMSQPNSKVSLTNLSTPNKLLLQVLTSKYFNLIF